MKNEAEKGPNVQGTDTLQNLKDLNKRLEQGLPDKEERKVQMSIKMLKELAYDTKLLTMFINTLNTNPEMKAPIAYQFAKALIRQQELELI